jgi:integrase
MPSDPDHAATGVEEHRKYRVFIFAPDLCELPVTRFHDLRHSAVSLLVAQGVHLHLVIEMLGHGTITLTMNTYSHVMPAANGMQPCCWRVCCRRPGTRLC